MYNESKKWLACAIVALLFFVISLSPVYKITGFASSLLFNKETSKLGCPNIYGLILHSIVFFVAVGIIFTISKESYGYPYFKGLANLDNALLVNDLRIQVEEKGCDCELDKVIRRVQLDPYDKVKAAKAAKYCRENCPGLSERGLEALQNLV
jgi:hypothetical protein